MDPDMAVILDNWFPETEKIRLRPDHTSHATGLGGPVESLIPYNKADGTAQLFGAANGNIFNVSSSGAVGGAVVAGMTNDRWQHQQIDNDAGGEFLFLCNGDDAPRQYDGTTWTTSAATGPTMANLIWCQKHQQRLWFGEKASLSGWYLGFNAISGTALEFNFAGVARRGGFIMAMGSWTRDGGAGPDDLAVFLTSEGEAIVYQGTNPASASTWAIVGVFDIGRPIGRRCMIKAGADLIMVTEDGFVSAATILSLDRSVAEAVAISRQINDAVNESVRVNGTRFGWQPLLYPKGQMLIFNIPQSSTVSHQYVFNTLTQAPCRFKGINALCWGLLEDTAFLGDSDGVVHKFDTGAKTDNGSAIDADVLPAFNYFGSMGRDKAFKLVEPIFESDGNPNAALDLNLDFQVKAPSGTPVASPTTSATWGVSKWGSGLWGTSEQIFKGWRGVRGIGRAASLRIRVSSLTSRPSLIATNYTFILGGQL